MAEEEGKTLTMVQYLPLLDGWEFQVWFLPAPVTLVKNRVDLIKRFDDYDGWLLAVTLVCDDALASPYIHHPTIPPISMMPYAYYAIGETRWGANTPYCPRYYQPVPTSTAGFFVMEYQPAYPMPYRAWGVAGKRGEFRVEMLGELHPASTQSAAHILALNVGRIVITDPEAFRRSLKKVLGADKIAETTGVR